MTATNRSDLRHLVMRLALGFALGWFGIQELHKPSDWAVFVPNFVAHRYPGQVEHLVVLHGFLLLLAACAIGLGVCYLLGSLLAVGMLSEVVLGLWVDGGGISDVLIRDIGLLGLGIAVALDPVRTWQLDQFVLARLHAARQPARRRKTQPEQPLPERIVWAARAGSGGALLIALLVISSVLRTTGTSSAVPANVSGLASARAQAAPSVTAVASASTAGATPAPTTRAQPTAVAQATAAAAAPSSPANTGTVFASWQYRQYAFEVYPGPISSDGQRALAGFDLSVQDQGATVLLTFKALSSRYQDATVTVDKANTAYFIETSMRDDPNGQENQLNDDGVVMVDPQGYLLQG
jgi:hypothetical protein